MKKIILTLTTIVALMFTSATFANAATNNNEVTVLNNIGNINKIEVRGNVEVIVSNGDKDQVTVNNNYYAESALVQDENGTLRISSYTKDKLVVAVSAKDLRSITVYDNSVVKSFGRFSAIEVEVNLFNNAIADMLLDSYNANITVNDKAKAEIAGNVTNYSVAYNTTASVNRAELIAENVSEKQLPSKQVIPVAVQKADDLVIVE